MHTPRSTKNMKKSPRNRDAARAYMTAPMAVLEVSGLERDVVIHIVKTA